jgi:hypothetical protein
LIGPAPDDGIGEREQGVDEVERPSGQANDPLVEAHHPLFAPRVCPRADSADDPRGNDPLGKKACARGGVGPAAGDTDDGESPDLEPIGDPSEIGGPVGEAPSSLKAAVTPLPQVKSSGSADTLPHVNPPDGGAR